MEKAPTPAIEGEGATRAELKFRALLESAPDAMVIMDGDGRIVLINTQTERLFGWSRAEILGRPVEDLVPLRFRGGHKAFRVDYFANPRVRPMEGGRELFGLRNDGSEFPVDISLSPIQTDEGILVSASIRDITDRKRIEQELREKNVELEKANLAKDRFLASMSHELRTPLNAIIGFTGTLLMRLPGPLTHDQDTQLKTIQSSARHLLSLINDLLDLAKIESGKVELRLEPTAVGDVLEQISASLLPLAAQKGLAFIVEAPPEPTVIQTDQRALAQILLNLATNAIKFTEHGSVRLRLRRWKDGSRVVTELAVVDTGPGIRPEDQSRLFQAFSQLEGGRIQRHEGTGLGLYLSQKLAGLLGGRIELSSEPGRGCTFALLLEETEKG